MRGAETDDGAIVGNRQLVDRYNEAKKKKTGIKTRGGGGIGAQPGARPGDVGGESGGTREMHGHDEIKQAVGEHGPATAHIIMRSPQGYHSITQHEDGHVHVHPHEHGSLEDAHEHGAHAFDDTEHLGDMPKDDYDVAEEERGMEEEPSRRTSRVGFMS